MSTALEFTGERFVPGAAIGEIVYEHTHRYAFARRLARGRRVLDAACGAGYGSALLSEVAASVVGVDIDPASIAHAAERYRSRRSLAFLEGSVTKLPLADASVDFVASFETVEHLAQADQPRMLSEFARVLAPGGLLLLSSPNPVEYSQARDYRNPFHLHELDRAELAALLGARFPAQRWYRQRMWMGSTIWSEQGDPGAEAWLGGPEEVAPAQPPEAMYFLVLAAREAGALPSLAALSLFSDAQETELRRVEAHAREAMRRDRLAVERGEHIRHLETLVAERDRALIRERAEAEAAMAALEADLGVARRGRDAQLAECNRLERALAAQERLLAYRQSLRWWLALPWLRAKLLLHRLRGA